MSFQLYPLPAAEGICVVDLLLVAKDGEAREGSSATDDLLDTVG